jgi:hypothetical protein
VPSTFFDTMPSAPSWHVGEDGRTILGDVFVEQDAGIETAEQLFQRSLPGDGRFFLPFAVAAEATLLCFVPHKPTGLT